MRILLLSHSFNSLCQRLFVELEEAGHEVSVEFDINDSVTLEAVELFRPDCLIAPLLKRTIPEGVWRRLPCFIVHPGIVGDRGPAALDWAILNGAARWGVTILQAEAELDAGPVWSSMEFAMREATKSSLYRHEVTQAAVAAVMETLERFDKGSFTPQRPAVSRWQPPVPAALRAIDWQRDSTDAVLRKVRSGDGVPGARATLAGRRLYLYNARPAPHLHGEPGQIVASSGDAIAVATGDGAVFVGHLKNPNGPHPFKLPAKAVLSELPALLPELDPDSPEGFCEISYREEGGAGFLSFDFYNGAMGTAACDRLLAAYRRALASPARVIVLTGGADFWSNGMDLNLIEASNSPSDESWRNINAIDDVAEAILRTEHKIVIAALGGNAGAGGVFLARAADELWLRDGVVLNPHYKDMGNLYGSEFWTYSLPRRTGHEAAAAIMLRRLPMGAAEAVRLGLADVCLPGSGERFAATVRERAMDLAQSGRLPERLAQKKAERHAEEATKPLSAYRDEELRRMRLNFYGFDPSYHVARYNFVRKIPKSRTPVTIARHRDARARPGGVRRAS